MPIVSSEITHDDEQADGRRAIRERHVDHIEAEHIYSYLAEGSFDAEAAMAARVPVIEQNLYRTEIQANIDRIKLAGKFAEFVLNYSTGEENAIQLRAQYKDMVETDAVFSGEFVNQFSDQQLANLFNVPLASVPNFRANKLIPAAETAAEIRASTGA